MYESRLLTRLLPALIFLLFNTLGNLATEAATPAAPVLVAVLVDTSGSVNDSALQSTRFLVRLLLQSLPQGSSMAIFRFDDKSELVQGRTLDSTLIDRALAGLQRRGNYTALNDAVYDASRYLQSQNAPLKTILLVTDGKDENSTMELSDGLSLAEASRIPVFTVGVGKIQKRALARIARLTGGEYLPLAEAQGIALAEAIRKAVANQNPGPTAGGAISLKPAVGRLSPDPDLAKERRIWLWLLFAGSALLGGGTLMVMVRRRSVARCANCGQLLPNQNSPCPACEIEGSSEVQQSSSPPPASGLDLPSRVVGSRLDGTVLIQRKAGLLLIKEGVGEGQVFTLDREAPKLLGRSPSADIHLVDPTISQEHCRITPQHGIYILHDLGSTNGTFVNGDSVERRPLQHGDSIRLGETVLTFLEGISH